MDFIFLLVCELGVLSPQTIQCGTGARRSREEYLGEVEFVNSNQDVASILSSFSKINEQNGLTNTLSTGTVPNSGSYYQHNYGHGKPCGLPKKVDGALLYRYQETKQVCSIHSTLL